MQHGLKMTRRAVLGCAAVAARGRLAAASNRPLGLALYTVRDAVAKRPDEVLKLAAAIGFTELEIMRSQIATVCKRSKDLGLRPISVHFETPIITGNWQAWKDAEMPPVDDRLTFDRVLDDANSNGVRNVVFNYLPPKERGDLDYYRGLADKLNAAASKCDAAGMKLWYHNHNFEFAQKAGGRPIDVLLQRLDPRLIPLEVDLFWVSMAGLNPAEFVQQNASRVIAVHLKDRVRGAAVPKFDIASVPTETYKEVGQGDLPFPKILEATARAGVKHHFVEQDHSPDPLASIRSSYDALRKLGY